MCGLRSLELLGTADGPGILDLSLSASGSWGYQVYYTYYKYTYYQVCFLTKIHAKTHTQTILLIGVSVLSLLLSFSCFFLTDAEDEFFICALSF